MQQNNKQNVPRLTLAIRARDIKRHSSPKRKTLLLDMMIRFLERYFGSPLLIEIPKELENLPLSLQTLDTIQKMQSYGFIEKINLSAKLFDDEPLLYHCGDFINKRGQGSDFFSIDKATMCALGEIFERNLWHNSDEYYKKKSVTGSYKQFKKRALNIFSLAGFSEEQKSRNSKLQFEENTPFQWTWVHSLTRKKDILCPTQLFSAKYNRENKQEPKLRWGVTTGLATGTSLEESLVKGILEIIERDAFMITWLNKLTPPQFDLEKISKKDKEIEYIVRSCKQNLLESYVLQLPTDFPVYASCAVVVDTTGKGPLFTVGASASFDKKTVIIKSLTEALTTRIAARSQRRKNEVELSKNALDRDSRVLYWAQKKDITSIDFLLRGKKLEEHISEESSELEQKYNYKKYLKTLISVCRKKGYEIAYIELTTQDIVEDTGMRTVFVIIPELQPLHLYESIPYVGGERLKKIPQELGHRAASVLNDEPHPFP